MPAAIYLDHQATTPLDPRVAQAMTPWLTERFGHPASRQHAFGWDAEKAVETARAQVADLIGATPREVVFTSGGTESDNLALKGVAEAYASKGRHLVTTAIENRPVLDCAAWLEARGWEVTRLAPDADGRVSPTAVAAALRDDTVLVSVQAANHEVGTVQALGEIGAHCAARGALLHTDATAAAAWMPLDVEALGVHLLSLTAHRVYGPKGIGALYVRRRRPRVRVAPQMHGGGHEQGLRSGTVNVAGAVGLGHAAEICRLEREDDATRVTGLRDALERGVGDEVEGVRALGVGARRLPGHSALLVRDVEGESLVLGASRIAFATGSACTSQAVEPSYVARALGLSKAEADSTVRFTLGRFTTSDDVQETVRVVADAIRRIRRSGAHPRS